MPFFVNGKQQLEYWDINYRADRDNTGYTIHRYTDIFY